MIFFLMLKFFYVVDVVDIAEDGVDVVDIVENDVELYTSLPMVTSL